ncbi:hypothetical protein FXO38_13575 [Capsicum annuum]|nr:hypothetical protein FXO38_13575 [Capsicum annuum]KAF3660235.1 hypothetical protein FXO37_13586 [Capsicum annuum]
MLCHYLSSGKNAMDQPIPTIDFKNNDNDIFNVESSSKKYTGNGETEEPVQRPIQIPRPPFTQKLKKKQKEVITWEDTSDIVSIEERLGVEALAVVIMNFYSDGIKNYDEMVCSLYGGIIYRRIPEVEMLGYLRLVVLRLLGIIMVEPARPIKSYNVGIIGQQSTKMHMIFLLLVINVNDKVLLYNSRLRLFPSNLKSRWYVPFTMLRVFPYGALELKRDDESPFKVNGKRVKHYMGNTKEVNVIFKMDLAKGQKVATSEETPPHGPRGKNPTTSPSQLPPLLKVKNDDESGSEEIFNNGLSRLQNGRTKWSLYLKIRLTTSKMKELPRFEEPFKQYGFEWMMGETRKYCDVLVRNFIKHTRELPSIDKMREATNTTDFGLIKDAANLLARKARQGADMLTEISNSQTKVAKTVKTTEAVVGAGGLRTPVINIERGSDANPPIEISLSTPATTDSTVPDPILEDRTHDDDGGTQPESPHVDVI